MEDKIDKAIDKLLENFFFEKVHSIMKLLNWRWATINGDGSIGYTIPSITTLIIEARKLLKRTYEECKKEGTKSMTISTGGFEAYYEEGYFSLKFILENDSEEFTE